MKVIVLKLEAVMNVGINEELNQTGTRTGKGILSK